MAEKISMFKDYNGNENTVNSIEINFDNGNLRGYLLDPISLNADAKYNTFFNLDKQLGLLGEIASFAAGFNIGKAGMWTRQYYNGGSYLKISGKMRVVSWNTNTTYAMDSMRLMIANCMPTGSIGELSKSVISKTKDFVMGKKEEIKSNTDKDKDADKKLPIVQVKTQAQVLEDKEASTATGVLQAFIDNPKDTITGFLGKLATGQPSRATIKTNFMSIGNMVLKDVDITPSKELIVSGEPLYADISFSFEQGEIITADQIKDKLSRSKPQIRIS